MPMCVQELLDDARLGLRLLVPGELEREIRWVHTTELADPSRYLQGGEVILTTGVFMTAGTSASAFVRTLAGAGVAAWATGCRAGGDDPAGAGRRLPGPGPDAVLGALRAAVHRDRRGVRGAPGERARGRPAGHRAAQRRAGAGGRARRRAGGDPAGAGAPPAAPLLRRRAGPAGAGGGGPAAPERARPRPWPPRPGGCRPSTRCPSAAGCSSRSWPSAAPRPTWWGRGDRAAGVDDRAAVDQALPFLGLELARQRALRETERRFAAELDRPRLRPGPAQLAATAARLDAFGIDADRRRWRRSCARCRRSGRDPGRPSAPWRGRGVAAVVASKGVEIVALAAGPAGGRPGWSSPGA